MSEDKKKEARSILFLTFGIVLILLFGVALFAMERYSAAERDALADAQSTALNMPDVTKIDPAFDGKLVSAQGKITTSETIKDALFGLNIEGLGLVYSVSYYQNVNTGEDDKVEWTKRPESSLDSDEEGVNTLILKGVHNGITYVSQASMGAYKLDKELLHSLVRASSFTQNFTPDQLQIIHESILDDANRERNPADSAEMYLKEKAAGKTPSILAKVMYDELYLGYDPKKPRLGDMRVTFYSIPAQEASLIGLVHKDTLQAYESAKGDEIPLIYPGKLNAEQILAKRIAESHDNVWLLRIIFAIFMILGMRAVISYMSRAELQEKDEEHLSYRDIFDANTQTSDGDYMQRVYRHPWPSCIVIGLILAVLVSFAGQSMI